MKVTTFQGIVENGQIRLDVDVRLPEKATVYVVIPDIEVPQASYVGSPRLVHPEQAADFKKEVVEDKQMPANDNCLFETQKDGHPVVLTINGKAALVVQDAAGYQRLLELAERAEMMEFLRESREDVDAGRVEPAIEALERLGKKYKLDRKGK